MTANANATIRANLELLAGKPELRSFLEHILFEGARQLNADSGGFEFNLHTGHRSFCTVPLFFGTSAVGILGLAFCQRRPPGSDRMELLIALAQQATLAIGLDRLAESSKDAAVLAERNRIGQKIHDGLAQDFAGILMRFGLANMRKRARAIGGACEICSSPKKGTRVTVRLPRPQLTAPQRRPAT